MKKKTLFIFISLIALVFLGYAIFGAESKDVNAVQVDLYKSSSCGCCEVYSKYLDQSKYNVNKKNVESMNSIKSKYKIPSDMQSCHTSIVEGYFVEGHIPVEAVNKLLDERPEIDGIAMPGMPSGSPGMPGSKNEDFIIYSIKDGEISEFMRI